METETETLRGEDLLRKIQELEAGHTHLQQEIWRLKQLGGTGGDSNLDSTRSSYHCASPQRSQFPGSAAAWKRGSGSFRHPLQIESGGGGGGKSANSPPSGTNVTDSHFFNILQSMGQSVYIYDLSGRVIYWNRHSEILLGYSAAEALGKNILKLIVAPRDVAVLCNIIHRVSVGESWTELFPIKHKSGEMNSAVATVTPFYDDHGSVIGITSVSCDSRPFRETVFSFSAERQPEADSSVFSRSKNTVSVKLGIDPQQPLQTAIASKISNLVSKVSNKVKSRIRTGENCVDGSDHKDATSSGACTPRGVIQSGALGVFYPLNSESTVKISRYCGDESARKPASQTFMNLMARKGNDREESEAKTARLVWPWAGDDQKNETFMLKSPYLCLKYENHIDERNRPVNEAPDSSSSSANVNSTSSSSNSGSTGSSPVNRIDLDTDCVDYEILWEELTTREQIGKGCCGTVYHGLWMLLSRIKIFPNLEYSDDVINSFKQEVSLMKRLRHPNVLLFMGAVTSPQHLCIVTEFLSRGSLFNLLRKNAAKLEWRRRVHMALDIVSIK
ncbi:hypothetical protein GQ457_13G023660 [Hibiscus cannabinus]